MISAIKVLNVFSTLLFAAILLLVYAYLPVSVDLNIDGVSPVHKQTFFYQLLVLFVVLNILLRVTLNLGLRRQAGLFKSWATGLIFIVNFYFTLLIGFVGVWNNAAHVSPEGYGYLNYIGPVLILVWLFGLFFFAVKSKAEKATSL